jgi:hypothetical protein
MDISKLEKEYDKTTEYLKAYADITKNIIVSSDNKKDTLLISMTSIIESHAVSICLLIKLGLSTSAYALFRPLLEATIKMRYMYHILEESKINEHYKSKNKWEKLFKDKSLADMAKEIDGKLNTEYFHPLVTGTNKAINDYNHTGHTQIASTFNTDGTIVGNCKNEKKQLEVIHLAQGLLDSSCILFLEEIGIKNGFLERNNLKDFNLNYKLT